MASHWRRWPIPYLANREVYNFAGEQFVTGATGPATTLFQWADYGAANRWLALWRERLERAEELQRREPSSFQHDPRIRPPGSSTDRGVILANQMMRQQHGIMQAVVNAMCNFYNALNLPWHMDPQQRAMYRQYLAGTPESPGGNIFQALYGKDADYSRNWYKANESWPTTCVRGPMCATPGFTGSIPWSVQSWFLATDPSWSIDRTPLRFVPEFGVTIVPAGSSADRDDIAHLRYEYLQTVVNHPGPKHGFPKAMPAIGGRAYPHFSFMTPFASGDTIYASGFSYYMWLRMAFNAAQTRTYEEIIFDTRAYTVYVNAKQVDVIGVDEFMSEIVEGDARRELESRTGTANTALSIIATSAPALGGTIGSIIPGLGTIIGSLIGGAVSLTANALKAVVRDPTSGAVDDLKRFKPILERAWLSGNPASTAPHAEPDFIVSLDDEPYFGSGRLEPIRVDRSHPSVTDGPGALEPTLFTPILPIDALLGVDRGSDQAHEPGAEEANGETSVIDNPIVKLGLVGALAYGAYRIARG